MKHNKSTIVWHEPTELPERPKSLRHEKLLVVIDRPAEDQDDLHFGYYLHDVGEWRIFGSPSSWDVLAWAYPPDVRCFINNKWGSDTQS